MGTLIRRWEVSRLSAWRAEMSHKVPRLRGLSSSRVVRGVSAKHQDYRPPKRWSRQYLAQAVIPAPSGGGTYPLQPGKA